MKRSIALVAIATLVGGAMVVGPAEAKKKKKKPKAPVCAAYVPGEMGAEAEHIVVTDTHTAEAPLTYPITLDADFDEGIAGDPPAANVNLQVDSSAPTAGLYVTFEFQPFRDYDLWAYWPDGRGAASSHGFQPLIATQGTPADLSNTESNHAGESHEDSENLIGVITPDCGGYTVQATNYFGEGGDFELKFWLGEGTTEPGVPE